MSRAQTPSAGRSCRSTLPRRWLSVWYSGRDRPYIFHPQNPHRPFTDPSHPLCRLSPRTYLSVATTTPRCNIFLPIPHHSPLRRGRRRICPGYSHHWRLCRWSSGPCFGQMDQGRRTSLGIENAERSGTDESVGGCGVHDGLG